MTELLEILLLTQQTVCECKKELADQRIRQLRQQLRELIADGKPSWKN